MSIRCGRKTNDSQIDGSNLGGAVWNQDADHRQTGYQDLQRASRRPSMSVVGDI